MKEATVQHVGRCLAAIPFALICLGPVAPGFAQNSGQNAGQNSAPLIATPSRLDEGSRAAWWAGFEGERAVTMPSQDAVMGFNLTTSIREILVVGGQVVKAGDLLVRGDDIEDVAEAKFQRARAETVLPVDRARAQLELAELEYQRQLDAGTRGAGNQLEQDRARVARDTTKIDLDLALLNQTLSDYQAARAEARVEKLSLRSPFDGVVDTVSVNEGQSVREGEPVIRVVSVDPIWIDVPVPTARTISLQLKEGSPAWVLPQEDAVRRVYEARVIEVAPTADGSSGTRRVRVEMQNMVGVVPGVNCWVRFTEPTGEWSGLIADPSKPIETAEASE